MQATYVYMNIGIDKLWAPVQSFSAKGVAEQGAVLPPAVSHLHAILTFKPCVR